LASFQLGIVAAGKNGDDLAMSQERIGLEALGVLVVDDHSGMCDSISSVLTGGLPL
jgi:hypothetical protein